MAAPKTAASPKTAPAKGPATPAKPAARTPLAAKPAAATKPAAIVLTTDEQKTVYALGLSIQRSIASFDLSAEDIQIVQQAIADAAAKKPAVELSEWGPKLQGLQQARAGRVAEKEKAASAAYLAKAATELG